MARKRIAFVIATDVMGGHEFQSAALAREAARLHDVTVLLNREKLLPVFNDSSLQCVVHEGIYFSSGNVLRQIAYGLRNGYVITKTFHGFDRVVVCAGTVEAGVACGLACLLRGIKPDLYLPFFYDRKVISGKVGIIYNAMLRGLMNMYPRLITINRIQASLVGKCYRGQVRVVGNSIEGLPPLLLPAGEPRLVFVGRLDRQKQVPELIQTLDFFENPFRELLLIGDGPLLAEVKRVASLTKIIKVTVLGWLDAHSQASVLRPSDILILNSIIEGEPIVLREAAERGMVAIAADIPGVRGVTHPALRYNGFQELRKLLTSPFLRERMQSAKRRRFRNSVNRTKQVNEIFE